MAGFGLRRAVCFLGLSDLLRTSGLSPADPAVYCWANPANSFAVDWATAQAGALPTT